MNINGAMGLYSVLKKIKEKEKELRILVLGLDNAGKTTLLKRLSGEPLDSISPTFGFNIQTLNYKGYKLNIWDVGGQKSIRTFWRNYFESTEGVIWVVDCADKRRLLECSKELHSIIQQERLSGASLLVMANKQDLARSLTEEQVKEVLELNKVEGHNWKIIGCSATTGHGLLEGINWIVSDIACRLVRYT